MTMNEKIHEEESPLLEFRNIVKVYGTGLAAVTALRGIDFSVKKGEFVAVMGPSGSGKSTCMNILGCLDSPTSGEYLFRGVDVAGLERSQRALLRRHYIGFIFQGYNLLNRTTALENVELPMYYRGTPARERKVLAMKALNAVGLTGWEKHTQGELSGGQQQRVAIARAIVCQPSVLFADEPTGNLDRSTSHQIMELLTSLNRKMGITIVMVTHEHDIAMFAGRALHFLDGRIDNIIHNGGHS
jgi:putative ABC transport system ATP-binding protein